MRNCYEYGPIEGRGWILLTFDGKPEVCVQMITNNDTMHRMWFSARSMDAVCKRWMTERAKRKAKE